MAKRNAGLISGSLTESDIEAGEWSANVWYVDGTNGSDASTHDGASWGQAFATIGAAVTAATSGDQIRIAPGAYAENVVIPHSKSNLHFLGVGNRRRCSIEPATGTGLLCRANGVTLENVNCAALGTDVALIVTGDRFTARGCKFENDDGTGACLTIGPGTNANKVAGLDGSGSDCLFEDCEFCWAATGIILQGTDYGAATEDYFRDCRFHNLATAHITEAVGSGGSAAVTYANLNVQDCVFENDEAGAAPTKFLSLNADNGNTGIVSGCRFPTAINGGKNLVSTACKFVGNYMTDGLSAAQPS